MRLDLSHLRDQKFMQSFQDCLNPLCGCGVEAETTVRYLLHRSDYLHERKTLLHKYVLPNILEQSDSFIDNRLLLVISLNR